MHGSDAARAFSAPPAGRVAVRRRRVGLAAVAAALAVALGGVVAPSLAQSGAAPAYPDLGMAPIEDMYLTLSSTGRIHLRFSATIVNVGTGPFAVEADRRGSSDEFGVRQRLFFADGTSAVVPKPEVQLVYAGDGHDHWHVRDLERYELRRIGVRVGGDSRSRLCHFALGIYPGCDPAIAQKSGFCFMDTNPYRPIAGAPATPVFIPDGCGVESSTDLQMGISVGWGDMYRWNLTDQLIDVTGITNGVYRLYAEADPEHWFTEADETNNRTWVDFSIEIHPEDGLQYEILRHGPAA